MTTTGQFGARSANVKLQVGLLLVLGQLVTKGVALSTCYVGGTSTACSTSCLSLAVQFCTGNTCTFLSYETACSTVNIKYYKDRIMCNSGICILANTCATNDCNTPLKALNTTSLQSITAVSNFTKTLSCAIGYESSTTAYSCTAPCATVSLPKCTSCDDSPTFYACATQLAKGSFLACNTADTTCKKESECITDMCNASSLSSVLSMSSVLKSFLFAYVLMWLASELP